MNQAPRVRDQCHRGPHVAIGECAGPSLLTRPSFVPRARAAAVMISRCLAGLVVGSVSSESLITPTARTTPEIISEA
jgi:hypothetical protein